MLYREKPEAPRMNFPLFAHTPDDLTSSSVARPRRDDLVSATSARREGHRPRPWGSESRTGHGIRNFDRLQTGGAARLGDGERAEWHRRASGLYEDLRRPATGLIRRAYGAAFSDDEIDDIYSSAWLGTLRALERRHADLADEEIRSYLLTAVANHASKELRRRKRKPIAPIEAAGAVVDSAATPEDSATTREASQITRDLLASLPPRRRAVMLLRYGWGLDPSEVCRMVKGLSPRAYRKEITRGVEELAAKLQDG